MSNTSLEKNSGQELEEGFVNFRGQVVTTETAERFDYIYNLELKEDDVWICSFPKSGTTWTQEMIWMITNDLDVEKGKIGLYQRSPYLELSLLRQAQQIRSANPGKTFPPQLVDSVEFVKDKSKKERICIKTHLNWNLLPKEIQEGIKRPKIVYVARNPKDVCVSYYHHSKVFSGYSGSFQNFADSFLAGTWRFTPYWNSVLQFWQRRHYANILFIKYEEMIKDLPAVIRKVSSFLEKSLTDEQVNFLANHLSFSNMKKNPAVNHEHIAEMTRVFHSNQGSFMRTGKSDSYKELMSDDLIRRFDEWTEQNTKGTGYST